MLFLHAFAFFIFKIMVQKVAFKFLIVKLHKAGAVLFRRPKIRKTKYA